MGTESSVLASGTAKSSQDESSIVKSEANTKLKNASVEKTFSSFCFLLE